jgi:aspartyl-tRNA(Asn)/glutamyl-tRNA(Gln) amidotransferase subunit C
MDSFAISFCNTKWSVTAIVSLTLEEFNFINKFKMIDQKTIQHIAKLARLKISPEDATEYGEQLSKVLAHFEQIAQINTDGVEPLVTPSEIDFFTRADEARSTLSTEAMLENAPDKAGNLFKVPPVV